jgi:mono/diheme cytochrome c family protein
MSAVRMLAVLAAFAATVAHAAFGDRPGPEVTRDGAAIYQHICQGCHMPDGQGAEGAARYPALAKNPRLAASTYPVLVVLRGRHGMPPFGNWLDDAQVASVVNHVRSSFGNAFADTISVDDVRRMRAQSAPPSKPAR